MSHKDDINVLSGRLHRIIVMLCDLEDDLGIIYDELDTPEQTCDYKQAAEYWQRMYEESFAERTCHIEGRYGNQYCTCCGEMVGTWDSTSELYIDGNMVELWNYCPNCGAKVVSE